MEVVAEADDRDWNDVRVRKYDIWVWEWSLHCSLEI